MFEACNQAELNIELQSSLMSESSADSTAHVGEHLVAVGRELANFVDAGLTNSDDKQCSPLVAVMLSKDPAGDLEDDGLTTFARARVKFFGSDRYVLIVSLLNNQGFGITSLDRKNEAIKLNRIEGVVDDIFWNFRPSRGPFVWPLHDAETNMKLLSMDVLESAQCQGHHSRMQKLLRFLHIKVPRGGGAFIETLESLHGSAAAFSFSWAYFYIQRLWVLAALCGLMLMLGGDPHGRDQYRIAWEAFKVALLIWGVMVSIGTRNESRFLDTPSSRKKSGLRNPCFKSLDCAGTVAKWLKILFLGIPVLIFFVILVISVLLAVVQLNIWLTYGWGRCVEFECYDPEFTHGFFGWLSEVGSDVLLAIVFEGLLASSKLLGQFGATLQNHELMEDYKISVVMVSVTVEALGKVGAYAILAFAFVPQWNEPEDEGLINSQVSCAGLWSVELIGETSLTCLQRRLPLARRRFIFERTTKGPFLVAPFIAILVKTVIPWVADCLESVARRTVCSLRVCDSLGDALTRVIALIFSFDGGSVGCFRYVTHGWPFQNLLLVPVLHDTNRHGSIENSFDPEELINSSLEQSVLKTFEPQDELLELKLGFLWVIFFAPIRPSGVFPTLLARLIECHTDLAKMLFVRRRAFPRSGHVISAAQSAFVTGSVIFAAIWSMGLSLLTYNDELWRWMAPL